MHTATQRPARSRRLPFLAGALALLIAVPSARAADLAEVKARGVLRHLGVPYANFVTGAGDVIALDAKVNFDDNALFRHKETLNPDAYTSLKW